MAPERLDGWADRRSDLYSLGVTLHELLTLRPFFETTSRAELMKRIAHDQPPAPTKIDAAIPVDLETIVLKALAKEPAARYHQAEQMADDLRRFLEDRPILARLRHRLREVRTMEPTQSGRGGAHGCRRSTFGDGGRHLERE